MPRKKTVFGGRRGRPSGSKRVLTFEPGITTHHHDLYSDPRWRALRADHIARFGNACQDRFHDPAKPRSGLGVYLELDHIVAVSDDASRALDPTNVMLRCRSCHKRKTDEDAARRSEQEYWLRKIRAKEQMKKKAEQPGGSTSASDGEPENFN